MHAGYLLHWSFAFLKPGVPRTNNGAESRNRHFKEHGTQRTRPLITEVLEDVAPRYIRATAIYEQQRGWQATPNILASTWHKAQGMKQVCFGAV